MSDLKLEGEIRQRDERRRSETRQGLVEGGVEAGELRDAGVAGLCVADEFERGRDVQRGEVDGGLQDFEDLWCEALVGDEMGAAVDDAMADGVDWFRVGLVHAAGGCVEGVVQMGEGLFGACEGLALGTGDGEFAGGFADAFDGGVEAQVFAVTGVEAELEGGGAAVDGEDGHGCLSTEYPEGSGQVWGTRATLQAEDG